MMKFVIDSNKQQMTPNGLQAPNSLQSQSGAVLIVVLMVVLLLALVGAIVARNSSVALDMSTAAQVKQLLKQSSDVPLSNLQSSSFDEYRSGVSQLEAMDTSGPVNFLRVEGQKSDEYVLCYQPTSRKGIFNAVGKHRVLQPTGNPLASSSKFYCDVTKTNSRKSNFSYTSNRTVVSTQVAMTRPTVNNSTKDDVNVPPFRYFTEGTDLDSVSKTADIYLRSYATSVLPSIAKNGAAVANDCLQQPIGGIRGDTTSDNQMLCLEATDVPTNMRIQDFAFKQSVSAN